MDFRRNFKIFKATWICILILFIKKVSCYLKYCFKENSKKELFNLRLYLQQTEQQSEFVQVPTSSPTISLNIGQPSPNLLPVELIGKSASHRFTDENRLLLQYGADQGYPAFRHCLATFLTEKYGFMVNPNEIMVSGGNSKAIYDCYTRLCDNAGGVVIEDPSYFLAFDIFRECGAELVPVEMDKEGIKVEEVEKLLEQGQKVSMLYTIPVYHNPTGVTMSAPRMEHLVKLAQKHDFIILADEPYPLLNCDGAMPSLISQYVDTGHVVSLGSFSKILAPGLRLGWIHSSQDNIKKLMQSAVIRSGGCVNPIMAGIVHSAIEMGHLGSHISALKSVYKSRKRALCDALRFHIPDIQFVEPEGGYFVWCKLPATIDSKRLLEVAKDFSVSFTPGYRCSSIEGFSSHIRLSFAFYTESEIVEGVIRIKKAIEKLKQSHAM